MAAGIALFLDAGDEEDLVIHGESVGDAEHQDGRDEVDPAGDGEVAEEVAALEDEHHGAEGGGEAEAGAQDRLQGDQ
ncbi:hypothetical protein GCM10009534_34960 [Kribbella sandramycini]|uniref:Uncharacterized protein n=1 Tax=Kribbella sandramycini TaxID=60450 RepID=A0A841SAK2_9ACTN|nr:hypothetical protein [Kribbella sandramycini]MBB6566680.1 hypothetical protein [Kribbella sandramycini]